MTAPELAMMRDMRVTHNHPRGWGFLASDPRRGGNSFSPEDIQLASGVDAQQMRAVSPRWLHIMRRPPGGWPDGAAIHRAFRAADAAEARRAWDEIRAGRMTVPEAEAERYHTVWTEVAAQLGLDYERRRRP